MVQFSNFSTNLAFASYSCSVWANLLSGHTLRGKSIIYPSVPYLFHGILFAYVCLLPVGEKILCGKKKTVHSYFTGLYSIAVLNCFYFSIIVLYFIRSYSGPPKLSASRLLSCLSFLSFQVLETSLPCLPVSRIVSRWKFRICIGIQMRGKYIQCSE
jgi:hypothetical protein